MAIIAILNPKGGCGKTTLTINLASALSRKDQSVLIVDSDPQGSARDWHAVLEENPLPLVALDRPNNLSTIKDISMTYDWVVLDGAAKLETMIAASIKISDLILIPVQPSPYDIWAASDLVEIIKARQDITDGFPQAAFVITRKINGTLLGNDVRTALTECHFPILSTEIIQRQAYPRAATDGQTVFAGSDQKAQIEIANFANEVVMLIEAKEKE